MDWSDNAIKEFWQQFLASNVRRLLTIIGTFLATHGWISVDQADGLTTVAMVEFIVSLLLLGFSVGWGYCKIKFNVLQPRVARESEPGTPIGVITTETLNKETFMTSV